MIHENWFKTHKIISGGSRISRRGVYTHYRGVDLQCRRFLVKMYAKMKELGPMGVACARHAPPPIHQ